MVDEEKAKSKKSSNVRKSTFRKKSAFTGGVGSGLIEKGLRKSNTRVSLKTPDPC
jgi:hypothetical protein